MKLIICFFFFFHYFHVIKNYWNSVLKRYLKKKKRKQYFFTTLRESYCVTNGVIAAPLRRHDVAFTLHATCTIQFRQMDRNTPPMHRTMQAKTDTVSGFGTSQISHGQCALTWPQSSRSPKWGFCVTFIAFTHSDSDCLIISRQQTRVKYLLEKFSEYCANTYFQSRPPSYE